MVLDVTDLVAALFVPTFAFLFSVARSDRILLQQNTSLAAEPALQSVAWEKLYSQLKWVRSYGGLAISSLMGVLGSLAYLLSSVLFTPPGWAFPALLGWLLVIVAIVLFNEVFSLRLVWRRGRQLDRELRPGLQELLLPPNYGPTADVATPDPANILETDISKDEGMKSPDEPRSG